MERHQVPLYLGVMLVAALAGLLVPALAAPVESVIAPALILLIFATLLPVRFTRVLAALRDRRFMTTILVVNFVAIPAVVFALSRIVARDEGILVGVLFVLLTPCIDYVVVFAGLAGGSRERLVAATPMLMLLQMILLPGYLGLFLGPEFFGAIDFAPFGLAYLSFIVVPILLAAITQALAERLGPVQRFTSAVDTAMVPLMMAVLALIVVSQVPVVAGQLSALFLPVFVFVLFAMLALGLGALAGLIAGLGVPERRSVALSAMTRNSLVILPLVLALPAGFGLAPAVVVTQTFVELVLLSVAVTVVPRLIPLRPPGRR